MCISVNLSHLSFADDIVVFTDGTPLSLNGMLAVFQNFARMSGLCINVQKSTVFAAGRGKRTLEEAAGRAGLSTSALPIKYLGLPLTTKTMTHSDYEPLLVKIHNRFLSWTSKALAYAGRLQLINSVIASMTNSGVQLFACFKDASMKLRVCVLHSYGVVHKISPLKLKSLGMKSAIGKRKEVLGGDRGRLKLGIARSATISEVMVGSEWHFRSTRDIQVDNMIRQVKDFRVVLQSNVEDVALWKRGNDVYGRDFSSFLTLDMILLRREPAPWHNLI